ncbi:HPr family phosphocarrier protein [Leucobacter sp. USHLN154]|uniref:HPr family phosphocarrier protein n=1 Tax=Leucobacter sp. USHLN154 TaxID=3081269 RepID=UPI0030179F52
MDVNPVPAGSMASREVVVASKSGLHARPARIIAEAAAGTGVRIAKAGSADVDASSILRVMSLGIAYGETVTLSGDNEASLDELASLLSQDLDAV